MKPDRVFSLLLALFTIISVVATDYSSAQTKSQSFQKTSGDPRAAQPWQGSRTFQSQMKRNPRFDVRLLEAESRVLKRIQDGRLLNRKIRASRNRAEKIRQSVTSAELRSMKKAALLGHPTRFAEAPVLDKTMVPAKQTSLLSSNLLINGKTQDTIFVGELLTLTFSFAPNTVSATLTILVDANGNGVADSLDIPLTSVLLLDDDQNDGNSAYGSYSLKFAPQDLLSYFFATLIFEINDYQTVSSATVTVLQKPTNSVVLGTTTPPLTGVAIPVSGLPSFAYVFSDTAGRFSFYVDRAQSNTITILRPIDVTGVSNGYVPPVNQTISVDSDTTTIGIVYTEATSFVEGYIHDQTGLAVAGATVQASGDFNIQTSTDLNGYYKVGVTAGTWNLRARQLQSSEYLIPYPTYHSVIVSVNSTVRNDISLLHSNSTIAGKVTLSGRGVGGTQIAASCDTVDNWVLTSTAGIYSVPVYSSPYVSLKYTVSASMGDVEGYFFQVNSRTNISPGAVDVDFAVSTVTGGVRGRITDQNTGLPIPYATIYASGTYYGSSVSDDSGYYRLSLRDGTYSLYVYADQYFEYSDPSLSIFGIMLTRNIALRKSGSISGKVVNKDGLAINNAWITAVDTMGYYFNSANSDMSGNYTLYGLRTSRYKVQCSFPGYVTQWYNNATDWDKAASVQVNEGFNTPNIDFVLSKGGSVSGRVVDKSGNPLDSIEIDVFDSLYSFRSYALTSDSGYYKASGLTTGNYYIETYSQQYLDTWYDGADSYYHAQPVSVVLNQETPNINFVLSKGGTISGKVMTKQHTALPYASIYVLDSTFSEVGYGYTIDSASYAISKLRPGVRLFAYASSYGYANRWYNNVGSPDSATPIVLRDGEAKTSIDFILPLSGAFSGKVRDVAGNPVAYAYIDAVDKQGNYVGYGYTDYDGTYQVTNLSGGDYFATAYSYNYEQQWYDHKRSITAADAINVVEEQITPNINFDLLPPPGLGNTVTIAEARKDSNNDLVPDHYVTQDLLAVCGVVTTPNLQAGIGQISYFIQDSSAGINVFYPGWGTTTFAIGDSVIIVGLINRYQGLTELMPRSMSPDDFGVLKHNAMVPRPKRLSPHQFVSNAETYEGQLIQMDSLYKLSGMWPGTGSNASVYLVNSGKSDTVCMFIDWDTNIDGTAEPDYPTNVVGVASQFSSGWAVNDGYEIVPRSISDITPDSVFTGVERTMTDIPTKFELYCNYPNPFNPTTTIAFDLPKASFATLKVFNLLGQEVATVVLRELQGGKYRYSFDAGRLSSGVYIYQLRAGEYTQNRKMVLMK